MAALLLIACRAEPEATPAPQPSAPAPARLSPAGLPLQQLVVRSGSGEHVFTVEMAVSDAEQSRGLMFRERLGPDEGMLFPFDRPREAGFWMRNTLIPLDMIFIREDGTIARIAANTVPRTLDTVRSGEPVVAVLEIAGGRSAELGIAAGDRVTWPAGPAL